MRGPDGVQTLDPPWTPHGRGSEGSRGVQLGSGRVQGSRLDPLGVRLWTPVSGIYGTASRPGSRLIRPLRWIVHASGADQQGGTCSTSTTYTDQDYLSRASTLLTLHVTFHHMNQSPESARGTAKGKRHVEDYNIRYTASFTAPLQAVNCLRRPVQALNCLRRPAQALNEVPYVHQQ